MNHKNNIILPRLLGTIVTALVLYSCSGFLEEDTSSFLSEQVIYETDGGTESALAGVYAGMCDYEYFPSGYANLVSAASGGLFTNHSSSKDILKMEALPSNKYLNNTYEAIYKAIVRSNSLIACVQAGGASQEVKDRAEGEARLMRAICYFNLVRLVGGVPLRTLPTTSETLHMPRASVEEIYDVIISDLEQAQMLLPETNPIIGRPSRYAACALLAKVYITLAGNQENSPYWKKALDEAKKAYGKYELVPLSTLYNVSNRNTKESIIEFQLTNAGGRANYWTRMIAPAKSNHTPLATSNPYGRIRPSKYLYDSFLSQYPGDPRIDLSFIHGSYTSRDGSSVTMTYPQVDPGLSASKQAQESFPYILKFLDASYTASGSTANFIYFRYADLLLILAEAENEVNGPSGAYKYVNEVLKRARESITPAAMAPENWNGMSKEEFRERIMQERRFELLGEQHEYYDLRRRGAEYLLNYIKKHNADKNNNFNAASSSYSDVQYPETIEFATKALLLPFPQTEIDSNNMISDQDQNPGY
ncbi:MAG: RagB/SusD family nutrient uptake outer membrane protein [Bacteroidales bacterium]|nr:RagB/SusD family nutrient uptake outer membrane protein [Bacteroidales bacterium]